MKEATIYWAVENQEGRYLLHAFTNLDARRRWIEETMGLSVFSEGGRGFPGELPEKLNPFNASYDAPVIWH